MSMSNLDSNLTSKTTTDITTDNIFVVSSTSTADTTVTSTPKGGTNTSPHQPQVAQPEKKTRPEFDLETDSETLSDVSGSSGTSMNNENIDDDNVVPQETDSSVNFISRPMNPSYILTIAQELKSLMLPEFKAVVRGEIPDISSIVTKTVKYVTDSLKEEIKQLRNENAILKQTCSNLKLPRLKHLF